MHFKTVVAALLLATLLFGITETRAASATGKWRGSWSSRTTGHRGPLKARVRRTGPNTYRALFVGRFAGIVPFVYPASLQRVSGTSNRYTSSQRLPLLGTYRMSATVTQNQFRAQFRGRNDAGTFQLSR